MIEVFCDGACEPNPGQGGWGFAAFENGVEIHSAFGGDTIATNNTMELTGAINALAWMAVNCIGREAVLYSDSKYVVDGSTSWRLKWKRHGWRKGPGSKEQVKNVELWQAIDAALSVFPVKLEWVKGHSGVAGNERADELSLTGRQQAIDEAGEPASGNDLDERYRQIMGAI